ncbi:MAG: hypothetical protein EP330_03765 [Deltaproteobacteria bacterium]|nr:MAG: hypothetical protein EP330_03765 [Deltaproteobacteria bacterium]
MLRFALLFATSTAVLGGTTASTPDDPTVARKGAYCEVVGARSLRVSCFHVRRDVQGVVVDGTAFSRGMAFATWRSHTVFADSGTGLAYAYTADMGGRAVEGISHVTLPEPGALGGGWYRGEDGRRVPFVVRDRASLEACLGEDVRTASSDALRDCLVE